MIKKRQILTLVSIAIISFLAGTMFNMNFIVTGGDSSPWNKVWAAITELQGQVQSMNQTIQSLNQTIEALRTEIPKKPQIITITGHPDETKLISGVYTDLLSIPNMIVPEGANVFAVTSGYFWCTETAQSPYALRYRVNDTYGEWLQQGSALLTNRETIEIHHAWTNFPAGTYTFAVQYSVNPIREVYVHHSRLTLIIF